LKALCIVCIRSVARFHANSRSTCWPRSYSQSPATKVPLKSAQYLFPPDGPHGPPNVQPTSSSKASTGLYRPLQDPAAALPTACAPLKLPLPSRRARPPRRRLPVTHLIAPPSSLKAAFRDLPRLSKAFSKLQGLLPRASIPSPQGFTTQLLAQERATSVMVSSKMETSTSVGGGQRTTAHG